MMWSYLKKQRMVLLVFGLALLVFVGVYFLYDVPLEALGYAALLCAVLGGGAFLLGFWQYCRRRKALEATMANLNIAVDGLPAPWDALEEDYQTMLLALQREKNMELGERDRQIQDMTDYYTLWVHQIKTPISAMRLLLQGQDTAESRELTVQLFRIEQYVEMVLAYLRMGGGGTDFVLRRCEVDRAVRQSVRKLAPLFIHGRVRLDLQPIGIKAITDEKWLCFAVEQLLTNAVKYTPQGTVTVCAQGNRLQIRDTGMGIAPEDLPRVFEKGFTGYNGRQDKKASGIGLYLCSQILTKLGHKLTLSSEPGKGTTAEIWFENEEKIYE